jgi:tetratricopeptide (TPR) repeat protein
MKKLLLLLLLTTNITIINVCSADLKQAIEADKKGEYAAALVEFTTHAEQGNAEAQGWLGEYYLHGLGVTEDLKTAKKWFTLAANQDRVDAQYELGEIYWKENDLKSAKKWFDLVIQQFKDYEDETIVKPEFEPLLLHYTKMRLAQIKIEESKTLLLESIK